MRRLVLIVVACCATVVHAQEKANPFAGTSAAFEARLKTLEEKRLDAAIAGEELSKAKSDQERQRIVTGRSATVQPAMEVTPAPSRVKPKANSAVEPIASTVIEPVRARSPRLVGTVSTPSGWVALVEHRSKVINVPDGAVVEGVSATQVGQDRAVIDGVAVTLTSAIARVASSSANPNLSAPRPGGVAAVAQVAPPPTDTLDLGGRASGLAP